MHFHSVRVHCKKCCILVGIARNLGSSYIFPDHQNVCGPLSDLLFDTSYQQQINTLLLESKIFGSTVFGDGTTVGKVPLITILGAGPNNATALLANCDCTAQMESGGKKDAEYIAKLILPEIQKMEDKACENNNKHPRVVDLVYFDGASNVQKAGDILKVNYPCMTVCHGSEHVVALFFSIVFNKVRQGDHCSLKSCTHF